MPVINMKSSADKIKGQGVSSAYIEQVQLVREGLKNKYEVKVNSKGIYDIMHYHTVDFRHYLSQFVSRSKSVTVGYVHFLPETVDDSLDLPRVCKFVFYRYMIAFYKRMDYLVTVNPCFIEKLEEYGIEREKIRYIPNFVSSEKFYPCDVDKKEEIKSNYGIDKKNSFVVLGVGQIQTRKGVMDFIEVAQQLPHIQFVWAGGFSFGQITDGYKELKKIVDHPPENVKFLGIVDREKMNDIYNMADIMFLPAYNELFPMTILEAMNCKTPLVLRDIDIYKDILFDYYAKGKTNDEFVDIITKLYEDTDFYYQWSQKSWAGHQFYSREHVLKMWEKFYDEIWEEYKVKKSRRRLYEKESI